MTVYRSDWSVERLGDFALHEKGSKPKRSQKNADDVFTYPYVDIQAFEKGIVKEYTDGQKCVLCEENDFLMVWDGSRSGYVGKAITGALGSTLMKISFPGIETDYAYYFLQSKYLEINSRAKGTGTPHVDPGILWNYQFAIPPLLEQRSIVAKIEQLFSELDNGIACLKKSQEQLKVYRQAVLKQAFEGELTKLWREQQASLPSAQDLLDIIKTEREQAAINQGKKLKSVIPLTQAELDDLPELPEGWGWIRVDDASSHIVDCLHNTAKFVDRGYYCIDTTCIEQGKINFDKARFVDQDIYMERIKRLKPKAGDLLFAREGTVGTVVIVPDKTDLCIGQRMMMFRSISVCHSSYLMYCFQSIIFKKQYIPLISGTTSPHLNIRDIVQLKIPFCSLQEQAQIVKEIETRLSVCDNMEATIREALEKAEALRQSILKKAFEGKLLSEEELTATRNDPDWEPAEKLLERIRAEKNQLK